MLDIATDRSVKEKIYIMNLKGRIDSVTASDFNVFSRDILRAGHRFFLFDAEMLEFISSAGIASIVSFARKLESTGGKAVFINLNREILLTFTFFDLQSILPVFTSESAARLFLTEHMERSSSRRAVSRGKTDQPSDGSETDSSNRVWPPRSPVLREVQATPVYGSQAPADPPEIEIRRESHPEHTENRVQPQIREEMPPVSAKEPSGFESKSVPLLNLPESIDPVETERRGPEKKIVLPESSVDTDFDQRPIVVFTEEIQRSGDRPSGSDPSQSMPVDSSTMQVREREPGESQPVVFTGKDPDSHGEEIRTGNENEFTDGDSEGTEGPVSTMEDWTVVHCDQCGVHLRVYQTGRHLCPDCGIEFTVRSDGSASFFEKMK